MNGKQLAELIIAALKPVLAPIVLRLKEIEQRAPERGERGDKGDAGRDGVDGKPGADGQHGKDGAPGERGLPGERGEPGQKGDAGEKGTDGNDGRDGERGEKGIPGDPGARGEPGTQGLQGERGERGESGLHGKDGPSGKDGENGKDGRDGYDGRDATQIEIVDLDVAKSYPRATYATWRGGLLRSLRTTDPLRDGEDPSKCGWQVVLNGIASEEERVQDDGRTVVRTTRYTNGKTLERKLSLAVVIDRGVYRPEQKYAAGDGVTFGGSFWIAQREPTGKPGEEDSGFRLAVKTGRQGRSAYESARAAGFVGSEQEWVESLRKGARK